MGIRRMFVRAEAQWVRVRHEDSSGSEAVSLSSSGDSSSDLASQDLSREDVDLTWDDFDSESGLSQPQPRYVGPDRPTWARMSSEGTQIEVTHLPGPNAADDRYFDSDSVFDAPVSGSSRAADQTPTSPSSGPSRENTSYLSPEASYRPSVAASLGTSSDPPSSISVRTTPSRIPVRVTPPLQRQSGRLQQKSPVNYRGLHSRGRRGQH